MISGARTPRRRALLAVLCLALPILACPAGEPPESVEPPRPLRIGLTERSIEPGERHRYSIDLARAQALVLELDQGGIDLMLAAEGPGAERLEMDNPRSVQRPETLTWVARSPGGAIVTVTAASSEAASGTYRLRAAPPRPATREDFAACRGYRWYQTGKEERAARHFRASVRAYSRAQGLFRQAGAELPEAWAWSKIGQVFEVDLQDPSRAEVAYGHSVDLERHLGGGRPLATVLNSLGAMISEQGEHFEAIARFQEGRAILEERGIGDPALEARLLVGEGGSQDAIGRSHAALELYRRAVVLARASQKLDLECLALLGIARTLRRGGDTEGAARACHQCLDQAAGRLAEQEAAALGEMAGIALDRERPEEALELVAEAEALKPSAELAGQRMHDRGRALGRLGRFAEAEDAFAAALRFARSRAEAESVRIDRAYALYLAEDHDAAGEVCEGVLARALEAGDPVAVASAHHCLARSLSALGRRSEALEHIEIAVGRVEDLRRGVAQDHLRSLFLASRRGYYELYIRLLLEEAAVAPSREAAEELYARAFEVVEASKGRTLLDGLRRVELEGEQDLGLLRQKREIEAEIAALEVRLLSGEASEPRRADLSARLDRLRDDLDLTRGALRAERPGWRDALGLEPAGLAEIRRALLGDGETQIVSYFLGDELSVAWVVGRESIAVERLESRATIERLAREAARGMAGARAPHQLRQAEAKTSALSRLVLDPIADALTARRLVLLKEGALLEVPFAALRIGGKGSLELLRRFEIVEAHSAATALALRRPRSWRPASNDRIAILGDAVFACDDERLPEAARCTRGPEGAEPAGGAGGGALDVLSLPRLEATGAEARAVAELTADREPLLLLDFEARAERLLAGELDEFAILHLSTHGFSEPEVSGLVFSSFDEEGRRIESLVREWQIYDLRLAADLVVLSACRTGQGERLTGEGVMSLARAFLWAGASTVVVSLWDVDDTSTRFLMERFYTELLQGRVPPGEALRRAQSAVRSQAEWAAPRYWAGFVVQGDWR